MRIDQIENEASSLQDADRLILTRNSEPLPEDKLKYILASNLGLGGGSGLSWVYLRDKKPQNTGGGDFTAGAWQTRDITEKVYDPDGICSLNSNQIVPDAGTYVCLAFVPYYLGNGYTVQARLQNVSSATQLLLSSVLSSASSGAGYSVLFGFFDVESSQALEIQHQTGVTTTNGFGRPGNISDEIYTQILFAKLAEGGTYE